MSSHTFDDRNITWRKLEGFDQISYFIYESMRRTATSMC